MEYSRLEPVVTRYRAYLELLGERSRAQEMAEGADNELRELGREELASLMARLEREEEELAKLLLPKDARDDSNIYLEVRAGTGGDEAAIFAGDLFRMYSRYAERAGLGRRSAVAKVPASTAATRRSSAASSAGARSRSSSSSPATHRVQRVPADRSAGPHSHVGGAPSRSCRSRTRSKRSSSIRRSCASTRFARPAPAASTSTRPTRRSASRTCRPGIVVECQDERSQHKNRSRAMSLLKARLMAAEREEHDKAEAQSRKLQVGIGRPLASASAPTTSRKAESPTTASTSRSTSWRT